MRFLPVGTMVPGDGEVDAYEIVRFAQIVQIGRRCVVMGCRVPAHHPRYVVRPWALLDHDPDELAGLVAAGADTEVTFTPVIVCVDCLHSLWIREDVDL